MKIFLISLLQVGCWQPQFSSYNPYGEVSRGIVSASILLLTSLCFYYNCPPGTHVPNGFVGRTFEDMGGGVPVPRNPRVHPGRYLSLVHGSKILTLLCIQRVKEMCDYNWKSYNFEMYGMDQMEPPPGHLLLYPVQVLSSNVKQCLSLICCRLI